jgi:hypothetical protein
MENKNGRYIYEGHVILSNEKLGHLLRHEDGEHEIVFSGKKHEHVIGEIINVEFDEDSRFTRKTTGKRIFSSGQKFDELIIKDRYTLDLYSQLCASRNALRNRKKFEDMSLKDLKKITDKNPSIRYKIRSILHNYI